MFDLTFQDNPTGLIIGVSIIVMVVTNYIIFRITANKSMSMVVSFAITGIVAYRLYIERFYGWEGFLIFALYGAVIIIFVKIIWSFVRGSRKNLGY